MADEFDDLSEELSDIDSIPSWIDDEVKEEPLGEVGGEADQAPPTPNNAPAKSSSDDQTNEYKDALQRLQADFENYKKRVARDTQDYAEQKNVKLLEELLPVIDAFNLALVAAHEDDADIEKLKKGIELVAGELFGVLEKQGLERIDAHGQVFDPELHDAVMHEETGEHEEEVVTEVLREGYKVRGKVVRPAMVKVAK